MNITLFGASGRVGSLLVIELLKRGHRVTAFVHSNTQAFAESPHLHIAVGDVHAAIDVRNAVQNADIVISTLGSWGTPTKDIVSTATTHLLPLLKGKRFIGVTGAGARLPHEKFGYSGTLNRLLLKIIASPVLRDADEHLRLLSSSDCSWVVVRSPVMTGSKKSEYTLGAQSPKPWHTIPRTAVVRALADIVDGKTTQTNAPFITA